MHRRAGPSDELPQHRDTIFQPALEAGMANPRVVGSVVRGEDREGSGLDILVDLVSGRACRRWCGSRPYWKKPQE